MAIQIIVEDGSIVDGANSYVSVADARIYAANRGVQLPAENDEVAAMLIAATDYLEAQGCRFKGRKVDCDQPLQWPRRGVYLCCDPYPTNKIPKDLIAAQIKLAMAANDGIVLQPNYSASDMVVEETVDVITTKYADPTAVGLETTFTGVNALLASLVNDGSCGGISLRGRRV